MAETYNRDSDRNDTAAKTLAIIALIIALLALGWAIKADNMTEDADSRVESSQQTQGLLPAENNDTSTESSEQSNTEDATETTTTPNTPTEPNTEEQP